MNLINLSLPDLILFLSLSLCLGLRAATRFLGEGGLASIPFFWALRIARESLSVCSFHIVEIQFSLLVIFEDDGQGEQRDVAHGIHRGRIAEGVTRSVIVTATA